MSSDKARLDRLLLPRVRLDPEGIEKPLPESRLPLPRWQTIPNDSKFPLLPAPKGEVTFVTTKVSKPLYKSDQRTTFDLSDPYNRISKTEYQALCDPFLKGWLAKPTVQKQLRRHNLITESGNVTCSLQEFNEYRYYLRRQSLIKKAKNKGDLTQKQTKEKKQIYSNLKKLRAEICGVEVKYKAMKAQKAVAEEQEMKRQKYEIKQMEDAEREAKHQEKIIEQRYETAKNNYIKWTNKQKKIRAREARSREKAINTVKKLESEAQQILDKMDFRREQKFFEIDQRRKEDWKRRRLHQEAVLRETEKKKERVDAQIVHFKNHYENLMFKTMAKDNVQTQIKKDEKQRLAQDKNEAYAKRMVMALKAIGGAERLISIREADQKKSDSRAASLWIIEEVLHRLNLSNEAKRLKEIEKLRANQVVFDGILDKAVDSAVTKIVTHSTLSSTQETMSKIIHKVVRKVKEAYNNEEEMDEEEMMFLDVDDSEDTERVMRLTMVTDADFIRKENEEEFGSFGTINPEQLPSAFDPEETLFKRRMRLTEADCYFMEDILSVLLKQLNAKNIKDKDMERVFMACLKLASHEPLVETDVCGDLEAGRTRTSSEASTLFLKKPGAGSERSTRESSVFNDDTQARDIATASKLEGSRHSVVGVNHSISKSSAAKNEQSETSERINEEDFGEDDENQTKNAQQSEVSDITTEELGQNNNVVPSVMMESRYSENFESVTTDTKDSSIDPKYSDDFVIDSSSTAVHEPSPINSRDKGDSEKRDFKKRSILTKNENESESSSPLVSGVGHEDKDLDRSWNRPLEEGKVGKDVKERREMDEEKAKVEFDCSWNRLPWVDGKDEKEKEEETKETSVPTITLSDLKLVYEKLKNPEDRQAEDSLSKKEEAEHSSDTSEGIPDLCMQMLASIQEREHIKGVRFPPQKLNRFLTLSLSKQWRLDPNKVGRHTFGVWITEPYVEDVVNSLLENIRSRRLPHDLQQKLAKSVCTSLISLMTGKNVPYLPAPVVDAILRKFLQDLEVNNVCMNVLELVLQNLVEDYNEYVDQNVSYSVSMFVLAILDRAYALMEGPKPIKQKDLFGSVIGVDMDEDTKMLMMATNVKNLLHKCRTVIRLNKLSVQHWEKLQDIVLECCNKLLGIDQVEKVQEAIELINERWAHDTELQNELVLSVAGSTLVFLYDLATSDCVRSLTLLPGVFSNISQSARDGPDRLDTTTINEMMVILLEELLCQEMDSKTVESKTYAEIMCAIKPTLVAIFRLKDADVQGEQLLPTLKMVTRKFIDKTSRYSDGKTLLSSALTGFLKAKLENLATTLVRGGDQGIAPEISEDEQKALESLLSHVIAAIDRFMILRVKKNAGLKESITPCDVLDEICACQSGLAEQSKVILAHLYENRTEPSMRHVVQKSDSLTFEMFISTVCDQSTKTDMSETENDVTGDTETDKVAKFMKVMLDMGSELKVKQPIKKDKSAIKSGKEKKPKLKARQNQADKEAAENEESARLLKSLVQQEIISSAKDVSRQMIRSTALQHVATKMADNVAVTFAVLERLATRFYEKLWSLKTALKIGKVRPQKIMHFLTKEVDSSLKVEKISLPAANSMLKELINETDSLVQSINFLTSMVESLSRTGQGLTGVKGQPIIVLGAISPSTLAQFMRATILTLLRAFNSILEGRPINQKSSEAATEEETKKMAASYVLLTNNINRIRNEIEKEQDFQGLWTPTKVAGSSEMSVNQLPMEMVDRVFARLNGVIDTIASGEPVKQFGKFQGYGSPEQLTTELINQVMSVIAYRMELGEFPLIRIKDLVRVRDDKESNKTENHKLGTNSNNLAPVDAIDLLAKDSTRIILERLQYVLGLVTHRLKQEVTHRMFVNIDYSHEIRAVTLVETTKDIVNRDEKRGSFVFTATDCSEPVQKDKKPERKVDKLPAVGNGSLIRPQKLPKISNRQKVMKNNTVWNERSNKNVNRKSSFDLDFSNDLLSMNRFRSLESMRPASSKRNLQSYIKEKLRDTFFSEGDDVQKTYGDLEAMQRACSDVEDALFNTDSGKSTSDIPIECREIITLIASILNHVVRDFSGVCQDKKSPLVSHVSDDKITESSTQDGGVDSTKHYRKIEPYVSDVLARGRSNNSLLKMSEKEKLRFHLMCGSATNIKSKDLEKLAQDINHSKTPKPKASKTSISGMSTSLSQLDNINNCKKSESLDKSIKELQKEFSKTNFDICPKIYKGPTKSLASKAAITYAMKPSKQTSETEPKEKRQKKPKPAVKKSNTLTRKRVKKTRTGKYNVSAKTLKTNTRSKVTGAPNIQKSFSVFSTLSSFSKGSSVSRSRLWSHHSTRRVRSGINDYSKKHTEDKNKSEQLQDETVRTTEDIYIDCETSQMYSSALTDKDQTDQRSSAESSRSSSTDTDRIVNETRNSSSSRNSSRNSSAGPTTSESKSRMRSESMSPTRNGSKSPTVNESRSLTRSKSRYSLRSESRSPIKIESGNSITNHSKSPITKESKSSVRNESKSPTVNKSKSLIRNESKSSVRNESKNSVRNESKSPIVNKSKSLIRNESKSSVRNESKNLVRNESKSPIVNKSKSLIRNESKSSVRKESKSPIVNKSKSSMRNENKSQVESESRKRYRQSRSAERNGSNESLWSSSNSSCSKKIEKCDSKCRLSHDKIKSDENSVQEDNKNPEPDNRENGNVDNSDKISENSRLSLVDKVNEILEKPEHDHKADLDETSDSQEGDNEETVDFVLTLLAQELPKEVFIIRECVQPKFSRELTVDSLAQTLAVLDTALLEVEGLTTLEEEEEARGKVFSLLAADKPVPVSQKAAGAVHRVLRVIESSCGLTSWNVKDPLLNPSLSRDLYNRTKSFILDMVETVEEEGTLPGFLSGLSEEIFTATLNASREIKTEDDYSVVSASSYSTYTGDGENSASNKSREFNRNLVNLPENRNIEPENRELEPETQNNLNLDTSDTKSIYKLNKLDLVTNKSPDVHQSLNNKNIHESEPDIADNDTDDENESKYLDEEFREIDKASEIDEKSRKEEDVDEDKIVNIFNIDENREENDEKDKVLINCNDEYRDRKYNIITMESDDNQRIILNDADSGSFHNSGSDN